ncbi:MAG: hypothetical protein ABIH88_01040 [Patescibacteria group bacterium]|nr:hypothetical protein [Patescibacteria group bacterium]
MRKKQTHLDLPATKEDLARLEKVLRAEIRLTAEEIRKEIGEEIRKFENRILEVIAFHQMAWDTKELESCWK